MMLFDEMFNKKTRWMIMISTITAPALPTGSDVLALQKLHRPAAFSLKQQINGIDAHSTGDLNKKQRNCF
jgi:hypothetical protein